MTLQPADGFDDDKGSAFGEEQYRHRFRAIWRGALRDPAV
jgi:hypothetical protein